MLHTELKASHYGGKDEDHGENLKRRVVRVILITTLIIMKDDVDCKQGQGIASYGSKRIGIFAMTNKCLEVITMALRNFP